MNKVFLFGRLGRDAEARQTTNGTTVATFSIATDDYKKGGEKETDWHNCVLWGKKAESLGQYLTKGTQVLIEGKIKTRSWEKDGETKYRTEINVWNLQLCGSRNEGSQQRATTQPATTPIDDDDIPF